MLTLMVHPMHGAMHAYNPNEIAYLEKLGWSVKPAAPVVEMPAQEPVVEAQVSNETPKKKPGRPAKT